MANYTTAQHHGVGGVEVVLSFTAGAPTMSLTDIVNDASRPVLIPEGASFRNPWIDSFGAYVYKLEYTIDPNAANKLGIQAFGVEIYGEHPSAYLANQAGGEDDYYQAYDDIQNIDIIEEAVTGNEKSEQENAYAEQGPMLSFTIPITVDNNYTGINRQVQFDGDFAATRGDDGILEVGKKPAISYRAPVKIMKAFFAEPYITDNGGEMAEVTEDNTGNDGDDDDTPIGGNPSITGTGNVTGNINFTEETVKNDGDNGDPAEGGATDTATTSSTTSKSSEDIEEPDPADLIALNAISDRQSLREIRQEIARSRRPMLTARQELLARKIAEEAAGKINPDIFATPTSMGFIGEVSSTSYTLEYDLEIPKYMLDANLGTTTEPDKFYVRIIPYVPDNQPNHTGPAIPQTPVIFSVDHQSQLKDMLRPKTPPDLRVMKNTPTEVMVSLRATDPTTTHLALSYCVKTPINGNNPDASGWREALQDSTSPSSEGMLDISFAPSSWHTVTFTPTTAIAAIAPNMIDIHASAAGYVSTAIMGGDFSHARGHCQPGAVDTTTIPHVTVHATNRRDSVTVSVAQIPDNVIGIRLMREDLTAEAGDVSERSDVVYPSTGEATVAAIGKTKLNWVDHSAAVGVIGEGRFYRYYCIMVVRAYGGMSTYEQISSSDVLIKRIRTLKNPPVDAKISASSTSSTLTSISVSITLAAPPRQQAVNLLLESLRREDVNSAFIEAIRGQTAESNAFQDLVIFSGVRIDMSTGEREYLGLMQPGVFIDNAITQAPSRRPPLYSGRQYIYEFKLHTRPPASFLKNVYVNLPSKKVPGASDQKVLASKFMNAYSANFGILPSLQDLEEQSVEDQFLLGETSIVLSRQMQVPFLPAKIVNAAATYRDRTYAEVMITWALEGGERQKSMVDHFRIFCTINGKTRFIAKVDSTPKFSEFAYIDEKYAPEVGTKEYFVVAVILPKYEHSAPSSIASVHRPHTIPTGWFIPKVDFKVLGELFNTRNDTRKKKPKRLSKNARGSGRDATREQNNLYNSKFKSPPSQPRSVPAQTTKKSPHAPLKAPKNR